jgi:hypothetical protein
MNSIPQLFTLQIKFVHKGFTLTALPHQKERIIKIFDKHNWYLCPDVLDGYVLFNWSYISKNESEIWEVLVALDILSHNKDGHYEVTLATGEILNPIVYERPTFFTKELYAKLFARTFIPQGIKHTLLKH